ncbi:MAG: hypothetical protein ACI9DJ_003102 [Algoriphagus sp.]|jgi:hypothetical protein
MSGLQENTQKSFKTCINSIRNRLLEDLEQSCYQYYSLNANNRNKVNFTYQEDIKYKRLFTWLESPERSHSNWQDNLKDLVKERAYTLTNRLVILMQLESRDLRQVKLISQGIEKSAFRTEQEFFIALTQGDDQGFGFILQQVWDQLALELPALFEFNEIHECIPVPGPTLLWIIQALNQDVLQQAWLDDTTLGWLYQYWNDPDKTYVEKKLKGDGMPKGKVETYEIGRKTQLFTDHYMVEWLLHNSIGDQWRAICKKNNWVDKENIVKTWKGYIWKDLEQTYIDASVNNLEDVKILDPAMGSGHFLVFAFDLLYSLYRVQREQQNLEFNEAEIVNVILSKNLHGIDIDSRAVQIAAAALYIKAKEKAPEVNVSTLQIVATDLGLDHLSSDDECLNDLRGLLRDEMGISSSFFDILLDNLKHANSLGSLITISQDIKEALENSDQVEMIFDASKTTRVIPRIDREEAVYEALEEFIKNHDTAVDLGVKGLAGQLEKGVRLIKLLRKRYDILCANPPYLATSNLTKPIAERLERYSEIAKGDLYALFFICFENLTKEHGLWCVVAQHNWMFLGGFSDFRNHILRENAILKCTHLGTGAFEAIGGEIVGASMIVAQKTPLSKSECVYHRLVSYENHSEKKEMVANPPQKYTYTFPQSRFSEISGSPMIYWWTEEFRQAYLDAPKLGEYPGAKVRQGLATCNNMRFTRFYWEVELNQIDIVPSKESTIHKRYENTWEPFLKGAKDKRWFEPLINVVNWKNNKFELWQSVKDIKGGMIKNIEYYFRQGIAFSYIGTNGFLCRLRRYQSIFDVSGSSIFCKNPAKIQVILSSNITGYVSQSLNPTINNQTGDIANLSVLDKLADYTLYLNRAETLYEQLFSSTESNFEYKYQHLGSEKFEVEEARIRDEIDKELLQQFSQETIQTIYQEIGESVFNLPHWDGKRESIPEDFIESYQAEESLLELSREYQLHPDSLLKIKVELGLTHDDHRQDRAFKNLSWTIGVLLGRFDAQTGGLNDLAEEQRKDQNIIQDINAPKGHSHGLLYLSVLDNYEGLNRKEHANVGNACLQTLQDTLEYKWGAEKSNNLWNEIDNALVLDCRTDWTPAQRAKKDLNTWIRTSAFAEHESIYSKRPIYFPLVSVKKSFFVWVNIHQWHDGTLNSILANYLSPDSSLLDSRIKRLRGDRQSITDSRELNAIEKEIADLDKLLDELQAFIANITQLATRGPAPELQEVEAPYVMDLDDGVMVNSSALWELVLPLWKDPKKWWASLSTPKGKKDFDWSHLAMRYWPERVMEKVKQDPSLAVAHSDYGQYIGHDLFTELHPEAAEKWEEQQTKQQDKNLELDI